MLNRTYHYFQSCSFVLIFVSRWWSSTGMKFFLKIPNWYALRFNPEKIANQSLIQHSCARLFWTLFFFGKMLILFNQIMMKLRSIENSIQNEIEFILNSLFSFAKKSFFIHQILTKHKYWQMQSHKFDL